MYMTLIHYILNIYAFTVLIKCLIMTKPKSINFYAIKIRIFTPKTVTEIRIIYENKTCKNA